MCVLIIAFSAAAVYIVYIYNIGAYAGQRAKDVCVSYYYYYRTHLSHLLSCMHMYAAAIIIKIYHIDLPARGGGVSRRRVSHTAGLLQIYVPYIISVPVFHALYDRSITGMGRHSARAV
uniref:Uncharacterized protein n=1 Tax=Schizaphis graminum TaxID=13262 RepID=A0A2S2PCG0_SCHGA